MGSVWEQSKPPSIGTIQGPPEKINSNSLKKCKLQCILSSHEKNFSHKDNNTYTYQYSLYFKNHVFVFTVKGKLRNNYDRKIIFCVVAGASVTTTQWSFWRPN